VFVYVEEIKSLDVINKTKGELERDFLSSATIWLCSFLKKHLKNQKIKLLSVYLDVLFEKRIVFNWFRVSCWN